jgi:LysM repeat protein
MKKLRFSGFDLRTLFLFSFLALAACSTGMDTDEDGEVEDSETSAETADAAPTDEVPQEVAEVEAPPPEPPAVQDAPPAPAEQTQASVSEPPVSEQPVAEQSVAPPAEAVPAPADPAATVASEPAQAPAPAASAEPVVGEGASYTVKAGDTLMKISWEQYGTLFRWREIYQVNKSRIADPNHVPPGTTIELPADGRNPAAAAEHNGEQYLIVQGDTLGKISNKVYGTLQKWKKLWENNRQLIRDPNKIYAGFYLYYVPEEKMTSTEEDSAPEAEPTG